MAIALTEHAISRYLERVKPALSHSRCRRELQALAEMGRFQVEDPLQRRAEDFGGDLGSDPDGYIELAPSIWGVVRIDGTGTWHILTVICNRSCSRPRREKRNAAKAAARAARQRRRKNYIFLGGERRRKEVWN